MRIYPQLKPGDEGGSRNVSCSQKQEPVFPCLYQLCSRCCVNTEFQSFLYTEFQPAEADSPELMFQHTQNVTVLPQELPVELVEVPP